MLSRDEFMNKLKNASNPDKAAEVLAELMGEAKALYDTVDALNTGKAELEGKVADLRDTNQRLFLRVADGAAEAHDDIEHEETPDEALENFMKKLKGE